MSYYNLEQALEAFKENLPKELLPFDLPQLADLCRQGILTPVFAYNSYGIEILEYYDGKKTFICKNGVNPEPDVSKFPEPMTTSLYDNYFTHERLTSLLDKSGGNLVINNAITYESNGSGYEVVLVANPLNINRYLHDENYSVYSDNDGYTINRESLLFPSEQIQSYIASEQTSKQNTPEQQLIAKLEREIADTKKQLEQARVKLANKPTDDLKDVPHQAYKTLDKVMYAMAKITNLDNSKPYSQNKPSLNAEITTILQNDGLPLEYEAVGKWLSRINDIKPLKK